MVTVLLKKAENANWVNGRDYWSEKDGREFPVEAGLNPFEL